MVNLLTSPPVQILAFRITLDSTKITVNQANGCNVKVLPDGTTSYATDTLTFRIRDGVNEWQDENPSHY